MNEKFLQVDEGTFSGRQPLRGLSYPVFWGHRNGGTDVEYWVFYKRATNQGFRPIRKAGIRCRLEMSLVRNQDVSLGELMTFIKAQYEELGLPADDTDFRAFEFSPTDNTPDDDQSLFGDGFFAVRQVNHPSGEVRPVAWVWKDQDDIHNREMWMLLENQGGGKNYVKPGRANPFVELLVDVLHEGAPTDINNETDFRSMVRSETQKTWDGRNINQDDDLMKHDAHIKRQ